ncbi:MAG TPA: 30S ribosomal protein S8e [Methanoregulaceae archaeon]|jgi:small subunit ribosomal protein S8e|nr:30S ribosomal protein S8e [Methanolinea sp.]MDD3091034.1 30S ribosomal protein S8e [Methanoregulaceae archaeon]MDD5048415.1 30S ribosomal protein S8e [Methanoregulaceae archaeon]MDD5685793.1 30S ribosomal protein S8e [Methanoregulaceae archaeon]HOP66646.1 30S ribosomal protein S8e [Methanoregulaceae archaeon]
MLWQGRSVRQATGGRYRPSQGKRRTEIGSAPADTHIGEDRHKIIRTTGGNTKVRAMRALYANVANKTTGEVKRVKIETVEQNVANPNYVRRNLLTKGAIIRTELGNARIASRPGQDGVINAYLVE